MTKRPKKCQRGSEGKTETGTKQEPQGWKVIHGDTGQEDRPIE